MEKLEVFEVVKPQGIKGELKARILADSILSVNKLKTIYDESGKEYLVKNIKDAFGGFAFILLDGVITRNDAELMRGKIFYALKKDIKKGKNSYFISDLKGLKVIVYGAEFGEITDVLQSNVDMFKITLTSGKTAYFPFLKALSPVVDLDAKTITVDGEKLKDIIYYES
ncbi:MAG: 16S rRNA processing protein RimM [Clostridia bacterium]|nr:16S rRNA processing protein RimM [Clostridia bacterium]